MTTIVVESLRFFLDIMGCTEDLLHCQDPQRYLADLLPEGEAWRSMIRIRLLHSVVRHRAGGHYRQKTDLPEGCSEDDAFISAEDMAAT